jgi:hypothetical protein
MDPQVCRENDERLNEVSDKDALWGPFLSFRPEKSRCFTPLRVLGLAATFGGFYGLFLDFVLGTLCRISGHALPAPFGMPLLLTFTYFVGFQFTLGPAWNRRARLMLRRADYMHSIGRASDQPH